jgi:hypothetical protein
MQGHTVLAPRFRPRFNHVYQAQGYTYVSAWFVGGRTALVRLLVGEQPPPDVCLGAAGSDYGNAGGVVRPGEFWTLECNRADGGGFHAMATPMYEVAEFSEDLVTRP